MKEVKKVKIESLGKTTFKITAGEEESTFQCIDVSRLGQTNMNKFLELLEGAINMVLTA